MPLALPSPGWRRAAPALAVLVLGLWLYAPALRHGLVSDDFLLLHHVRQGPGAALGLQGTYHFYPLGLAGLWLQRSLCGLDGAFHHAVSLAGFLALALAAGKLGRHLGLPRAAAWAGALLFVTSSHPFEVPLWAIGTLYSASALLGLAALATFPRLLEAPSGRRQLAFTGLFTVALLVHEQALGLLGAAALWGLLVFRPLRLGALARSLAPSLGVVVFYLGAKALWAEGTSQLPGLAGGWLAPLGPWAFHGLRVLVPSLPADAAWAVLRPPGGLAGQVFVGLALVALAAWLLPRLRPLERFFAAWALAHVGLMAFAIGLASRHYALPLVPALLLAGSLLQRLTTAAAPRFAVPTLLVALAPLSALGVLQLRPTVATWGAASRAAERLLQDAERLARAHPERVYLYAVNLPDGLPLADAEPAYIFRLGFEAALQERLPGHFQGFERRRTQPLAPWVEPFGRLSTLPELDTLAAHPQALVLLCPGPELGLQRYPPSPKPGA